MVIPTVKSPKTKDFFRLKSKEFHLKQGITLTNCDQCVSLIFGYMRCNDDIQKKYRWFVYDFIFIGYVITI